MKMTDEACCTCATVILPQYDEKTEKPTLQVHRLECCGRIVCEDCIVKNPRFASYCEPPTRKTCRKNGTLNRDVRPILPPILIHAVLTATLQFRTSTGPTSLPQGLRDPPAYSPPPSPRPANATFQRTSPASSDEPPAYSAFNLPTQGKEKNQPSSDPPAEDVLHFLDPSQDSVLSLSLRYGVPQDALKRKNGLFADHLLAARRTILIPGEFYKGGVSLSPEPMESEEEEIRKAKIRRWMVACKVSDIPLHLRYDIALLYLQQSDYNLGLAVEAYLADEQWEKEHPLEASSKGRKAWQRRGKRKIGMQTGLTGEL